MAVQSEKRIAYLIHTFPLYSLTFIVDEIEIIRGLGGRLDLFGVRKPSSKEYPESYKRYAQETQYALPIHPFKHIGQHLRTLFLNPTGYFSCLKFVFFTSDTSIRQKIKLLAYFGEAVELSGLITTQKYTHLHVHFLFGGALVALFLKHLNGIHFSLTAHGTDFMVEKFLLDEKVKQADFVRIATQTGATLLASFLFQKDRCKLFQLPFGMNVSNIKKHKKAICSHIHSKQNTPIKIMSVGRLVWQKGHVFLIEAAKLLKERGVAFTLELIGEGALRETLEKKISEYGLEKQIVLLGALSHQAVFYKMQSADIFVFPSVSEGFGLVLLEAMASGLAIVASETNGVPEIITEGKTGLLCEAGNAEALAETLFKLCSDKELGKQLALNALEDVMTRFDNQVLVSALYFKMMECCKN